MYHQQNKDILLHSHNTVITPKKINTNSLMLSNMKLIIKLFFRGILGLVCSNRVQ